MSDELDVELQRDNSIFGVRGSVRRPDAEPFPIAILDREWRAADMGFQVPEDSPVASLAAYLAVTEPGGEEPWPNVEVNGIGHHRVDSRYIVEAKKRLDV